MEEKIKVKCNFQISPFCKKIYFIGKYRIKYNREKNNGQYRCKLCAIQDTHLGEKSHFFKNDSTNHYFFNKIDNEIKAYILGIIAGDGSITNKTIEIVANKKDIITLKLFKDQVSPKANIIYKSKNCRVIKITSRQISKDLCKYLKINPGKKSDKITLPKLNKKLMYHFIRGLVDTDGWISNPFTSKKFPQCFYSSTSKIILKQVQQLFILKNIKSAIYGIKLCFTGQNALDFMNILYSKASVYLTRKKEFYNIWKTWIPFDGTIINPSKRKLKRLQKLKDK